MIHQAVLLNELNSSEGCWHNKSLIQVSCLFTLLFFFSKFQRKFNCKFQLKFFTKFHVYQNRYETSREIT